ncbi:MAG TPA: DUF429 domain-containing protein [Kofleriaceae bacterium]|nr:DUF429 domain-containing protein [Kofleriaceae bacterium]
MPASDLPIVIGVDGCKAGWVAVRLAGGRASVTVHRRFDEIAALEADVIGVDMPLGLVEHGRRDADAALRAFLGARRATVFEIPPRAVVSLAHYEDACDASQRLTGRKISLQAFHLFPKLREVDRCVADTRVVEIHPETSFAIMAGAPLAASKHTPGGARVRRRWLRAHGIAVPTTRHRGVGIDDVLDAAAVAWSARRHALGQARCFRTQPAQRDASGRVIAVIA